MGGVVRDPAILALTVGQLLVATSLYYLFPAMVLHWQTHFGWSVVQLMGAFSIAMLVQGLVAKSAGRLIDRGYGRGGMIFGASLGAACLVAITYVEAIWQFYLIWAIMGIAMGLTLYESVFALIMRSRQSTARQSIAFLTLVAGLSSSVAYFLSDILAGVWGWQGAVLFFSGLVIAINLPLIWYATGRLEPGATAAKSGQSVPVRAMDREGYLPLTVAFSLSALGIGIVISHLLPMLNAVGVSAKSAILAASLIGPAQVLGRLMFLWHRDDAPVANVTLLSTLGLAVALLPLFAGSSVMIAAFVFAVLHGVFYGISSILRPIVVREILGAEDFGAIQGAVMGPAFVMLAAAPFLGALLADRFGYSAVLLLCFLSQLGAAIALARMRSEAGQTRGTQTG